MKTKKHNSHQQRTRRQVNSVFEPADLLGDPLNFGRKDPADALESLVILIEDSAVRLVPRIAEFNDRMRRLHALGLFNESLFLGPIVLQRAYGIFGDPSS